MYGAAPAAGLRATMAPMPPVRIIGAGELLAAEIVDREGAPIGQLRDLLIDLRLGRIAYGLVALDLAPDWSERLIAVPWNAVHIDGEGKLRVNASRESIERGPTLPMGLVANLLDHEWAEFIHSYFGARPYWERNAQHA
jgi:sporulation protein YlmC with PRC-barrel domain